MAAPLRVENEVTWQSAEPDLPFLVVFSVGIVDADDDLRWVDGLRPAEALERGFELSQLFERKPRAGRIHRAVDPESCSGVRSSNAGEVAGTRAGGRRPLVTDESLRDLLNGHGLFFAHGLGDLVGRHVERLGHFV